MPSCALRKGFGVRSMRPGVGTRSRGWLRGGSRALSSRSKRRVGNLPSNSAIPRDFQPGEKVQPWLSAAGSRPGYPAATSRFIPNVKLKRLKKKPKQDPRCVGVARFTDQLLPLLFPGAAAGGEHPSAAVGAGGAPGPPKQRAREEGRQKAMMLHRRFRGFLGGISLPFG